MSKEIVNSLHILCLDLKKALLFHVLSPHNNTRFKVASDLSKSVLGSLTLK